MNSTRALVVILALLLQSCANFIPSNSRSLRHPASAFDADRLEYLLGVDRFHFYLSHLWLHLDGKASEETVRAIKSITPADIMAADFSTKELADAGNYDRLLARLKPNLSYNGGPIKWDYNFLKRKLNEAFVLKEWRLSLASPK